MDPRQSQCCGHSTEATTCQSVTAQYMDVSVPLSLKPYAMLGALKTECCGKPSVTVEPYPPTCGCCGCELVITQTVCVRIPLSYGAEADIGELSQSCRRTSPCPGFR